MSTGHPEYWTYTLKERAVILVEAYGKLYDEIVQGHGNGEKEERDYHAKKRAQGNQVPEDTREKLISAAREFVARCRARTSIWNAARVKYSADCCGIFDFIGV